MATTTDTTTISRPFASSVPRCTDCNVDLWYPDDGEPTPRLCSGCTAPLNLSALLWDSFTDADCISPSRDDDRQRDADADARLRDLGCELCGDGVSDAELDYHPILDMHVCTTCFEDFGDAEGEVA